MRTCREWWLHHAWSIVSAVPPVPPSSKQEPASPDSDRPQAYVRGVQDQTYRARQLLAPHSDTRLTSIGGGGNGSYAAV